jgi:hypothetical protein
MRLIISFALFLLLLPLVSPQTPTASPAPQGKFVGVWVLNSQKSAVSKPKRQPCPTPRPKYQVVTINLEGSYLAISGRRGPDEMPADQMSADNACILGKEAQIEKQWFYQCDGKSYGTPQDSVSCHFTADNALEGSNVQNRNDVMVGKRKEHFWKSEVSPDGSELKTSYYEDRAMTKLRSAVTYDRQRQ